MKRKTLEIYALVVCFASIVTLIISLGIGIYSAVKVIKPGLTISAHTFRTYQSNEKFRDLELRSEKNKRYANISDAALTKMRLDSWNIELGMEKRRGFQSFTQASIFVVIGLIVFLLHWRMAKREKETQ